jgi:hypothetical protein
LHTIAATRADRRKIPLYKGRLVLQNREKLLIIPQGMSCMRLARLSEIWISCIQIWGWRGKCRMMRCTVSVNPELPDAGDVWDGVVEKSGEWWKELLGPV